MLRRQRDLHRLTQAQLARRAAIRQSTAQAGIDRFADKLAAIPYVFVGATAALLQGAPVPATMMESGRAGPWGRNSAGAACSDVFTDWLGRQRGARWHDGYQEYGYAPLDPRQRGERRWRIIGSVVIRVELVGELPEAVEVRHDGRCYRVLPLTEVEITDSFAARVLRKYRDHAGFQSGLRSATIVVPPDLGGRRVTPARAGTPRR